MIAKYREEYFNISPLYKKPIRIWRYDFVDGFNKKVKDSGLVVFEKFVDITEIDEIFEVSFAAVWHGAAFNTPFFKENTVYLRTGYKDEANKYGFQEEIFDRGEPMVWCKIVEINEVEEFTLYKTVYAPEYFTEKNCDAKQKIELVLSKEDWLNTRTKMEIELSPWNYTNKK